jgi:hypothetical protein
VRKERKKLSKESDFRVLPDYPYKKMYLEYRQQLRDFQAVWTEGTPFPTPPEYIYL